MVMAWAMHVMMTMTMMVARMWLTLTRWWQILIPIRMVSVMPATYVSATMDQAMRMAMAIVLMWTAMMGMQLSTRGPQTWQAAEWT